MRNLGAVIDQMLAVIPSSEESLVASLLSDKDSFIVTSPETVRLRWHCTAGTLGIHLGDEEPTEGWQKKVVDIWMDRITTEKV